jgi:hypothetical protein
VRTRGGRHRGAGIAEQASSRCELEEVGVEEQASSRCELEEVGVEEQASSRCELEEKAPRSRHRGVDTEE